MAKTLGIVGMGQDRGRHRPTGSIRVVDEGFLHRKNSQTRSRGAVYGARRCELDELLTHSDYVCLAVPLSAETRGLIGERELKRMKPTADTCEHRAGPVVDQDALADALRATSIMARASTYTRKNRCRWTLRSWRWTT